ncbi:MAG: HNH endonuclease signature motif containing protein [Nitrosarchaeum sp.]|nr:HNH endonuclease signature motif containing protein [Nitrosarchaeum sp.]
MHICKKCNKLFLEKKGVIIHERFCGKARRRKEKISVELTDRRTEEFTTLTRIVRLTRRRLKDFGVKCSICEWNESSCDLHHIIPDEESFENLIIICPNCHRIIHIEKKYTLDFLRERSVAKLFLVRPDLYEYYMKRFQQLEERRKRLKLPRSISKNILLKIEEISKSNIEFAKYGWVGRVALILSIKPQKVNRWMRKYMYEFYDKYCFKRS